MTDFSGSSTVSGYTLEILSMDIPIYRIFEHLPFHSPPFLSPNSNDDCGGTGRELGCSSHGRAVCRD